MAFSKSQTAKLKKMNVKELSRIRYTMRSLGLKRDAKGITKIIKSKKKKSSC